MPVCRYCGQKAGWFSDAHVVCMNSAQQGCERVASTVASAVVDKLIPPKHSDDETWATAFAKQVWSETKPQVDQLATEHRIPPADLRDALRKGWSTGAEQVATAELLRDGAAMDAFLVQHKGGLQARPLATGGHAGRQRGAGRDAAAGAAQAV